MSLPVTDSLIHSIPTGSRYRFLHKRLRSTSQHYPCVEDTRKPPSLDWTVLAKLECNRKEKNGRIRAQSICVRVTYSCMQAWERTDFVTLIKKAITFAILSATLS